MSAKLLQNPDGANFQARAVLEMVRYLLYGGIEKSWNNERADYDAEPLVARFDNCREQGYVVYLRTLDTSKQINIAFYEHRNSEGLYAQVNNKRTFNAPILNDITESMKDKWDAAFTVGFGKIEPMARFVVEQLEKFWSETIVEQAKRSAQ